MLQRLVTSWLRQQAQQAVFRSVQPGDDARERPEAEDDEVDVACLFASASEAGGLVDRLAQKRVRTCHGFVERVGLLGHRKIVVVETDQQQEKLARIIHDVVALRTPKWVISSGFASSLDETVRRGDIVVANRIVDEHGYSIKPGTKMSESPGLRVGTLLAVDMLPGTADEQRRAITNEALICAVQTAVIAEVCRQLKLRLMAVHVVADRLGTPAPTIVKQVGSQTTLAGVLGAAAGALIEKPSTMKELWSNRESSLRLSDRLAGFLASVVAQL